MNKLSNIVEGSYILTTNGYLYIEDLVGNCTVWDGRDWKDVIVTKNNNNQDIYYELKLDNGSEIICTHDQKLNIVKDIYSSIYFFKPLYEINENSLVSSFSLPELEGNYIYDLKYPYMLGYFTGFMYNIKNLDNTIMNKDDIDKILNIIPIKEKEEINLNNLLKLFYIYSKNIIVPVNATKKNKLLWLSGIIELNSSLTKNTDAKYLNIYINSKDIMIQIRYLCNTLGMSPKLIEFKDIKKTFIGGIKKESTNIYYRLLFNADDTNKIFLDYDINTYIFKYDKSFYSIDQDINNYTSIKKINKITKKLNTYSISNSYSCIINGTIV
jgi:hypothetical protein